MTELKEIWFQPDSDGESGYGCFFSEPTNNAEHYVRAPKVVYSIWLYVSKNCIEPATRPDSELDTHRLDLYDNGELKVTKL